MDLSIDAAQAPPGHHWLDRAAAHSAAGDYAAAEACYAAALAAGADPECGAGDRWLCAMRIGHFEAAWAESDRVIARRRRLGLSCAGEPRHRQWLWDGTPPEGRDVRVACHHGLGDSIQFLRYLPLLARRARTLSLAVQQPLIPLLGPWAALAHDIESPPEIAPGTLAIESTELPHVFRTTLATVPAALPYLHPDPGRVAAWRAALPRGAARRIGLCWAAGAWRPERSIALRHLSGLARRLPGVAWVSLQRGPEGDRLAEGAGDLDFVFGPAAPADLADTAALIAALDLVISVDTMAAHLAGALARPVALLLHQPADWRWLVGRADTPWYPTMRLYRQAEPGDWAAPLRRLGRDLETPGSF